MNPGRPNLTVTQLIVFFARNPDEELTTHDVCAKTGIAQGSAYARLNGSVKHGLLTRVTRQTGRMKLPCVYTAGPELLKMIGQQ